MHDRRLSLAVLGVTLALAAPAFADHNSKWGEGWANMPNDIHNTRIDTRGDNTAFRDFVRQGNGAESVNRFKTDRGRTGSARSVQSRQTQRSRSGSGKGRR